MKTKYNFLTLFTFALFLIGNTSIAAQELSGLGAAFVDVGTGARPSGLGGAYTAVTDVYSTVFNPAGIAELKGNNAAFAFTNHYNLIPYSFTAYTMSISDEGTSAVGFALWYSGDDALREITFQASYGAKVTKQLSVGATLKYRRAQFGDNSLNRNDYIVFEDDEFTVGDSRQVQGSGNGIGIDIGALYQATPEVTVGLMLKDIYSPVFYDSKVKNQSLSGANAKGSYNETVPMSLSIGTLAKLTEYLRASADYTPSFDHDVSNRIRGGLELELFSMLYIRGGYQNLVNDEQDEKYSVGLGFDITAIQSLGILIDYAYSIEQLANSHRFSLGLEF